MYDTILQFLIYLSKLEHISFDDVAHVLEKGSQLIENPLALVFLRQCNPSEESVKLITKMCPKIMNLELVWEEQQDFETGIRSLTELHENQHLQVDRLGISGMMFTELFTVFKNIGPNLIELNLELEDNSACYNLLSLGNICPNLQILKLQYFFGEDLISIDSKEYEAYFPNLKSLDLVGSGWDPERVLKLLLSSAPSLEEAFLGLNINTVTEPFDISSWLSFVAAELNPLANLKYLELWKSFTITTEAISMLYKYCKHLQYISFYTDSKNVSEGCMRMQRKCLAHNLDFLIDCRLFNCVDSY